MLELEIIQELKPNTEILDIIKNCTYITKNGKFKHLLKTNLQFVEPTYISYYSYYIKLIKQPFYQDSIINCLYIEDNNIVDNLLLILNLYLEKNEESNPMEWTKLMNNYKNNLILFLFCIF